MTDFSYQELHRLVSKIPETDPASPAYHCLMQSIEMYNALALTVDEILNINPNEGKPAPVEDNVVPFNATDFPSPAVNEAVTQQDEINELVKNHFAQVGEQAIETLEKVKTPASEPKTYDAPTVRKALLDARARGVNVKEILKGFGVDGFQALPADRYGDLMAALAAV